MLHPNPDNRANFPKRSALSARPQIGWLLLGCAIFCSGCQSGETPGPSQAEPKSVDAQGANPAAPAAEVVESPASSGPRSSTSSAPATPEAEPFKAPLSAEELTEGWISLFDGETLFGWQAATAANWAVSTEQTITVSEGEPGLLVSAVPWSDYVLRLEFRFAPGTNSGIFLHTLAKPQDPKSDCYELNIAEPATSPFPTGSLVGRQKSDGDAGAAPPDTWHHYEVAVQGGHVVVKLNGKQVLDYTDPMPLGRGHIGLQLNKGAVAFRNVRLQPLGLQSLFNGRDLTGWKEYPQLKSRFSVTEAGELRVQDGRGQLETAGEFGDFVARLECRTNAPQLNSGLFFRCVPGGEMLGYESQIHNGFKNGDRRQAVDCGTGGIFRRVNARLVAADDLTWFTKTINAAGPEIAVWVNGYQVTQWTDDRQPDENPRKGLRTSPGTFQLQGHDPTTDILFRNLAAVELAKRRGD
jgi:hypothetical protein